MTAMRALAVGLCAAVLMLMFALTPALFPTHRSAGTPATRTSKAEGLRKRILAARQRAAQRDPTRTLTASAAPAPGEAASGETPAPRWTYPVLAVHDATSEITAADLEADETILAIVKERALTRDDVRAAARQLVFWLKIRAQAYELYSKPTFRSQVRADRARLERIYSLVLEREIDPYVPATSDAAVEAYYKQHSAELVSATHYRFQHMARLSANSPREAESKIREAYARLLRNEPFDRVARVYAQGVDNPGEPAEETVSQLPQRLVRQLEALAPGEISAPFQTTQGWAIVQLLERFPARPMTLEEARARIVAELRAPEREKRMKQLLDGLEKQYAVERFFDRIPEDMRIGYNVILYSLNGKDYSWNAVQDLYLFAGRDVTLQMSRGTTARPLIERQLQLRMLEQYARDKGFFNDPSVEAVYRKAIDSTLVDSCAELEKTRRMQKNYKPSEQELRQYYVQHKGDKYMMPPTLEFQFLYIPYRVVAGTGEREQAARKHDAEEAMRQVEARLARGDDFGALVQQYSQHPSKAQQNGLMHYADAMMMLDRVKVEQYLDRPYENYPAFEWNDGLAKVRITDASRGSPFPFEDVRSQVERLDLYEETEARVRREIREELIQQAGIEFKDGAIAAFVREMNRRYRNREE